MKPQFKNIILKPDDPIQALAWISSSFLFLKNQKGHYNDLVTQIMYQHRGDAIFRPTKRLNGLINMTNPSYANEYTHMAEGFICEMKKIIVKAVGDAEQELRKIDNPIYLLQFTAPIEGNVSTDTGDVVSDIEAEVDNKFNEADKYLSRVASIALSCGYGKPNHEPNSNSKADSTVPIKLLANKLIINDNAISFMANKERLRLVRLFFFDNGTMKQKSYPKDEAISRLTGEDWLTIPNDRRAELMKRYQNARREINRKIKAETNIAGDFIIFTSNEEFVINKNLN